MCNHTSDTKQFKLLEKLNYTVSTHNIQTAHLNANIRYHYIITKVLSHMGLIVLDWICFFYLHVLAVTKCGGRLQSKR